MPVDVRLDMDEESQTAESGSDLELTDAAKQVPHQDQQVLISWVFIFASVTLFLDFLSLQQLVTNGPNSTYFVRLNNWFGTVSCVAWFFGFAILAHWLHRVGATRGSLAGAYLKLTASVFFNLQPMTGVAGTANGAGIWWSNLVGIVLFHLGNLVSCADMWMHPPPGANSSKGWLFHGNFPVTGMWIYQLATWALVFANILDCTWGQQPPAALLPTNHPAVATAQYVGAALLTLGSAIYCLWCDGFRTLAL